MFAVQKSDDKPEHRLNSDSSGSSNQCLLVLLSDQMMCSYFFNVHREVACLLLIKSK